MTRDILVKKKQKQLKLREQSLYLYLQLNNNVREIQKYSPRLFVCICIVSFCVTV